ncbi:MAG: hypothetical protein IJI25_01545 [Eubacterium sp.]|nr:hypothetical protein [Eubacterium sp.]
MNHGIKHKLSSQKGASITYALLLFLVCAVISSVVLTAGTAASGRMSQIAEMDQKYYSVTSAAELIKELVNSKRIVAKGTLVETVTKDQTGAEQSGTEHTESDKITIFEDGVPVGTAEKNSSGAYVLSSPNTIKNSFAADAVYTLMTAGSTDEIVKNLTLEAAGSDSLKVDIVETINPADGSLTFKVSNAAAEGAKYSLILRFEADTSTSTGTKSADGPREHITDNGSKYDYVTTTTETTTSTWKWNLSDMTTTY